MIRDPVIRCSACSRIVQTEGHETMQLVKNPTGTPYTLRYLCEHCGDEILWKVDELRRRYTKTA